MGKRLLILHGEVHVCMGTRLLKYHCEVCIRLSLLICFGKELVDSDDKALSKTFIDL